MSAENSHQVDDQVDPFRAALDRKASGRQGRVVTHHSNQGKTRQQDVVAQRRMYRRNAR